MIRTGEVVPEVSAETVQAIRLIWTLLDQLPDEDLALFEAPFEPQHFEADVRWGNETQSEAGSGPPQATA